MRHSLSLFAILVSSLASLGAPFATAATGTIYAGSGGTGSARFTVGANPNTKCTYSATMRITKMRATLDGNAVTAASLAATMTEANDSCTQAPLGEARERYRFRKGSFDGRRLLLTFASAQDNAAKHDVTYEGTVTANGITGVATFARYDCLPNCNWTVKAPQTLTRQP
jgi:hypothetical protein